MEAVLQVWPVLAGFIAFFAAMAGLTLALFRLLRADIASVRGEVAEVRDTLRGEIASVRGEIASVRDSLGSEIASVRDSLGSEIASVRDSLGSEIASVREEVVALRVEVGFIRGKLDLLERYIMRRNDPAAEPAE